MKEIEETGKEMAGGDQLVSIPCGGPIYVRDMVGSLTRVSDFESLVLDQLQDLRQEIRQNLLEIGDDDDIDISVDDLKIITEHELVDKAIEVAFKDDVDGKGTRNSPDEHSNDELSLGPEENSLSQSLIGGGSGADVPVDNSINREELSNTTKKRKRKMSKKVGEGSGADAPPDDSINANKLSNTAKKRKRKIPRKVGEGSGADCPPDDSISGEELSNTTNRKMPRKRKMRINPKNDPLDERCIAKINELMRIREKQDEDKAAANLHSFNGSNSCITNEAAKISSERITSLRTSDSAKMVRIPSAQEHQHVLYPEKETILCIEVCHNKNTMEVTQEFLVLGRQFLNELRDKICCVTDEVMKKAGQHDPSGYFLIENVFCNDLREASASDYSKPIRDWLRNSKEEALEKWEHIVTGKLQPKQKALVGQKKEENLPQFRYFQMHKTRFCDLSFRLGAGYLYCHQGDCKHLIVIRDMRLMHPEDVQSRLAYPLVTFQFKVRPKKCSVCKLYRAEKVTVDDKWAGENPCYFCIHCYYMLHYVDGALLYDDFTVYDYYPE